MDSLLPFQSPWEDSTSVGDEMLALIEELFPLPRSITGDGLRQTLALLQELIPVEIHEVATGTQVFDWTIPKEWKIHGACIEDRDGNRIVDFCENNLHVVGYSRPVDATMTLSDLKEHVHTLPGHPDWIPYRTAYYDENWGFCMSHRQLESLADQEYRVRIDSELFDGSLTYAEFVSEGQEDEEILIFTHTCHPSLCNDNLTGIAVAAHMAAALSKTTHRLTYRFVFAPATIGSITWLARNEGILPQVAGGLVLSVIGDGGPLTYKRSRRGHTATDAASEYVLSQHHGSDRFEDFSPWGYDERQFCSPGINLPVGRLTRTPHGEYPEYHTSADDLSVVNKESLVDSLRAVWQIFSVLEGDLYYINTSPKGEPQLGRRGLYRKIGGYQDVSKSQLAMLWLLNQSDGEHSLLDIAKSARLPYDLVRSVADDLQEANLLVLA